MNIIPDPRVLLVQALGFILLLLVFRKFLFGPILGVLDARRREIDSTYEQAESQKAATEQMRSEYEQRLAQVDTEIRARITEAVKEGQAIREEIITDSRAKADEIIAKAQDEIRREKEKALVELKTTVADIAIEAAGKLIDERMDEDKHREMVARFIEDLGEVKK